ncbi:unnamed protein product [Onchocerca ochengi]|uniref:ACB domain-containing protein n=1 Tax=Onchocerca ochengi TaxID=42157 RepID=A0A182EHM7_ONCOC|nr:unnamed protein product [Onchocerca ochengi]
MNFDIAAEEMRRLDSEPNEDEKLKLYGIYKQAIHGDIPSTEDYRSFISPSIIALLIYSRSNIATTNSVTFRKAYYDTKPSNTDQWNLRKYNAWIKNKGKDRQQCEKEYIQIAEEMIKKYGRKIVRCKWNSEVWTVDY